MDANLQKYFELLDELKTKRKRANDLYNKIWQQLKDKNLPSVIEYENLQTEVSRISLEAEKLAAYAIRANLEMFEIADMRVTGILNENEREKARCEMLLSDLCGLTPAGLVNQMNIKRSIYLEIIVIYEKEKIGRIGAEGIFSYKQAKDLKTALGWWIATDGGREKVISNSDLIKATTIILQTITTWGTDENSFLSEFLPGLSHLLVYNHTTRFADGYCPAARLLWQVATRELGMENPGYTFCY